AQNHAVRSEVWGSRSGGWQALKNWLVGAGAWFIAYPWVIFVAQGIGIILALSDHRQQIDQVAVRHLKDALNHPGLLFATLLGIILLVPIVEELIFRGFLQGWLRNVMGRKIAIVITAAVFALFHFSSSQGVENFELLPALFILACYLGFLRERQDSLWA